MISLGTSVSLSTVFYYDSKDNHKIAILPKLLDGKRTIMFGGPAPFSRLETEQAVEFSNLSDQLLEHVDEIYAIYCQDSFVTREFQRSIEAKTGKKNIQFLADGNGEFITRHFLSLDLSANGLGLRSHRWAGVFNPNRELVFFKLDNFTRYNYTKPNSLLEYLKTNPLK